MGVLRSVRGAAWGYTRVQRRAAAVPGMSAVGIIFAMQEFYFDDEFYFPTQCFEKMCFSTSSEANALRPVTLPTWWMTWRISSLSRSV